MIGNWLFDTIGFQDYDYKEHPPFVNPSYHDDILKVKLKKINDLPKYKRPDFNLKKRLEEYCIKASLVVSINNSI